MKGAVSGSLGGMAVNVPVVVKEFFMKDFCMRVDGSTYVSVPSTGSKEQTDRYRQKFIKEAKNTASLSHPNIVKVIDVFEENGTVYYVMEYLEGDSLRQLMENGPLPEQQAVAYIRQIGDALRYMHDEKHLCHLDVKPSNIMLNAEGMAMLIDFGISKSYDEKGNETSSTPVGLTQGYAPLEQYQNALHEFSPVTDIYSLGATLLALLTGQVPPEASIVNEDGLGSCPPYISQKVWQAINAAMQPKRKDRPQHVSTFLDILDNGLPEATRRVDDQPDVPTTPIAPTPAPHPAPHPAPAPFHKSETNWTKYVVIVAIAALIGGGIFWVANNGGGKKEQQEQAAAVQVTDFPVTVKVDGKDLSFKYTGSIQNNLPEGKGKGVYATNAEGVTASYEGDYHKGLRHGNGKITFSSGDTYEGGFANDKFEGKGRYTFAPSKDDDTNTYAYYEGTYKNDKEQDGAWYNRKGKKLVTVSKGKEL
jgi:serine/threonine protein kinase